jgi:periplasmic protein TonB
MIRILLLLAMSLAAVAPLHAQGGEKIGSFDYRPRFDEETGRDESFAYLGSTTEDGRVGNSLTWICGDSLEISFLVLRVRLGERARMIYAFDQDPADTVDVFGTGPSGGTYLLPVERNRSFTARARTARGVRIAVVNGRRQSETRFPLDSAGRVLGRLACVRELEPPLQPDPRVFDMKDVDDPPRLTNPRAVRQALAQAYTPEQQAAGASGRVLLEFQVRVDGSLDPASLRVVESSDPVIEAAALRAARMMRFVPGRVAGRAVITFVTVPMGFQAAP